MTMGGRILFVITFFGVSFAARTNETIGFLYFWFFFWLGVPMLVWAVIYYVHVWWVARSRSTPAAVGPIVQAPGRDLEILSPGSGACFCWAMQAALPSGSAPRYASQCLLKRCPDCC